MAWMNDREGQGRARESIVTRVVRGTVFVALLSSLVLASTAAIVARVLWRSSEERELEATLSALVRVIQAEAVEDKTTIEKAAPDAIDESALVGFRIEVWNGDRLVVERPARAKAAPGAAIAGNPAEGAGGWLVRTAPLPDGLTLRLALPEGRGRRALRIFWLSLALSAPLCLLIAVAVGRYVGRRTTRALVAFSDRIAAIRGVEGLTPDHGRDAPAEVADLERVFGDLLDRLADQMRREREFASNASHELRTPLTAIRLRAERARRGAEAGAAAELDTLVAEVDRMVRLVDSLLVLARDVRSGVPRGEVVNLADVTRAAAARTFGGASGPESELPDEALVGGDEALIGIAVENLLDNARKFTSRDGPGRVVLTADRSRVRLTVTSPGARISDSEREKLFERFFRSPQGRETRDGHGLGLPLARHIARLHGGEVSCISEAGEDARFALDLPAWGADQGSVSRLP